MFTNPLPNDCTFSISFTPFCKTHWQKDFKKKYKGKIWELTEKSIIEELSRITLHLQFCSQVDQLQHKDSLWIFKYDFRITKSKDSTKSSGCRCICFLDLKSKTIEILLMFAKTHLPKNQGEQQYIKSVLEDQYIEMINKCR